MDGWIDEALFDGIVIIQQHLGFREDMASSDRAYTHVASGSGDASEQVMECLDIDGCR